MSRRFVTEFTGVGVPPYSGTGFSLTEKLIGGTGADVEETEAPDGSTDSVPLCVLGWNGENAVGDT